MIDLEERFDTSEEMTAFIKAIMPIIKYCRHDVELLRQQAAELQNEVASPCGDKKIGGGA